MKNILELNENEVKEFLLKQESYFNFDLPIYFSFQELINKIDLELSGKQLSDFRKSSPRDFDDVNYQLISNKDGKYAWRPFKLINPAIYVSLVHSITKKENWQLIVNRFQIFRNNLKIECHSLPMVSTTVDESNQNPQIYNWWLMIEQKSIALALDYRYVLETDITDCYGSIYTHSLSWALHTKEEAKKKKNRNKKSLIGVSIDNHLQDMSFGQTNGIPQGSLIMDFVAEIVLGYVDSILSEELDKLKITEYKILRYRDDYRIFTNNPFQAEQITKILSEILSELGLRLNAAKTKASDNVIKNSIKADKRYWITNKRRTESKQKWLIQLFLLSEQFPNSGTLDTQMRKFLEVLENSKRTDPNIESLISLTTEIAYRNPRVIPTSIAILSLLINQIESIEAKKTIIARVKTKFEQIPNSSLLKVWLQRLYLKIDDSIEYDEQLCKKVLDKNLQIWNTEWLNDSLKAIISETKIVSEGQVESLETVVSKVEIKMFASTAPY
ncbi:MAG: RNA-directed DNA polymerase [Maribacter stanieri]